MVDLNSGSSLVMTDCPSFQTRLGLVMDKLWQVVYSTEAVSPGVEKKCNQNGQKMQPKHPSPELSKGV